jgi:hypothetical protein
MKRTYDLRHSGITWRLNSGVPATEVAAWAGHSVESGSAGRTKACTWESHDLGRVWGAAPSQNSIPWQAVTKRDNEHFREAAGQRPFDAGQKGRPQQDSNLRSRLRRR